MGLYDCLLWDSSFSMGLSGAGFVTMPMKRGVREASSTRAKRKGEFTENMETERMEVTTVVAEASTPSSLSSIVLACRMPVTVRGWSDIPERSGPENREPRPDGHNEKQRQRSNACRLRSFGQPLQVTTTCGTTHFHKFGSFFHFQDRHELWTGVIVSWQLVCTKMSSVIYSRAGVSNL